MRLRDIYWIAGLLEGEGCFSATTRGYPKIAVGMTDPDVVWKVASILNSKVGGPYHRQPPAGEIGFRKPIWTTQVSGTKAVGWMMTLFSLLGIRRRDKIKEILVRGKYLPPSVLD